MNKSLTFLVFATLVATVHAADDTSSHASLNEPAVTNLNRIGVSYRMGFNLWANMKNLGGYSRPKPAANPLKTAGGDAYNFDNGFIFPDATTDSAHPGYTWYYGYVGADQAGSSSFTASRTTSPANASSSHNESEPQHGFEISYNRQLGHIYNKPWGIEIVGGFADIAIQDRQTLNAAVIRETDTFTAGGGAIIKPGPFTTATPAGPPPGDLNGWPLVSISPTSVRRDVYARGATISGTRDFEAQAWDLRFGPYIDLPLGEKFMATLSAGGMFMLLHSTFSVDETVTITAPELAGLPAQRTQGSDTTDKVLFGGYASGMLSYALTERVRLFGGATFQISEDFTQEVAGKSVNLELGQSVFVSLGVSYSF